MKYRRLGRTGMQVSEIGHGTWGMGGNMWLDNDDRESAASLNRAFDLGVNFVDTALVYGEGHSEQLVGSVLKTRKERIYVATKIPPINRQWPARKGTRLPEAFTLDHIVKCTEQSLRNLGIDCIDIQQFHVWNDEWANEAEWRDALEKLKSEGKIRFAGISMNSHEPDNGIEAAKTGSIDAFQVFYNLFDQSPEAELFGFCGRNDIGIIARVPFDEGSLSGHFTPDTQFPEGDFRNRYFSPVRKKEIVERLGRLERYLGAEARDIPEMALRYVLSHPEVSTVIPGMRKVKHVESNCAVSDGRKLSGNLLSELRQFHFYNR